MDKAGKAALQQVEIAEAELAVLRQEHVLRHLLPTGEPAEEAIAQLARLRKVAADLGLAKELVR